MSRHVVLIHRYFHPDTPAYASILREIALGLGAAGHRVTVLTCQPSYNPDVVSRAPRRERIGPHVEVRRWPVLEDRTSSVLKLVNLLWFCARLLASIPRLGRVDRVMAASTPPVALARVASWLARAKRAEFVYHHQDIYPEVAVSGGQLAEGMGSRLLSSMDARTDRKAARAVVLSEDMSRLIASRGVDPSRIAVINNFDPWRLQDRPAGLVPSTRLRVVYAGNIGRFQNLEIVFSTLAALKDDDRLEFHFIGDGPLRPRLEKVIETESLEHVHVHGYVAPERLAELLQREADVGLVTLSSGVIQAAYPSKTMSYLRNGVPVVAFVESGTDLVRQLEAYGAGWSAAPERPESLAAVLARLAGDRAGVTEARGRARTMYVSEFSQEVAMPKWLDLLGAGTEVSGERG